MVNKNETATAPISNEDLAVRIKNGETQLITQLWRQVYGLIYKKAAAYYHNAVVETGFARFELEDLVQQAYFAVLLAVDYYDPEKMEIRFITVLGQTLKTAFAEVSGTRSSKRDALLYSISGDQPVNEDGDVTLFDTLRDQRTDTEDDAITEADLQALRIVIDHCMQPLTDRQRGILHRCYWDGNSLEQIALYCGLSRERIRQEKGAALDRMYDDRFDNGLIAYLETHTNFYQKGSLQRFKQSGESIVESIVFRRDRMAREWMVKLLRKARRKLSNE